jgi:PKHD-type hydroxylase
LVAQLHQVLNEVDRKAILSDLSRAPMVDGRLSAGDLGQDLKLNMQVDSRSDIYRSMINRIMAALTAHEEFNKHAIPRRIFPPLIARYGLGAHYNRHVDNAFIGPFPTMRSDLSITIFLNDPEEYGGGVLSLETPFGPQQYRLQPGDAVLYPTHYLHSVSEVTSGERLVVVTWVESLVQDPLQREVISDLSDLMEWSIAEKIDQEPLLKIEKTRLNLLKMWAST